MPQPLRIALLALIVVGVVGLVVYTFVRAFRNAEDRPNWRSSGLSRCCCRVDSSGTRGK
jgi:hypothetical protein